MGNEAIKAFIKAQKEMGRAIKATQNSHFKSQYADLSSVREACIPALNDNGFAVMQTNGVDDAGNEFVDTIFTHETGESFQNRIHLRIGKNDMQGYGSAITYARRYGLMGLSGLAPEDDDGNAAAGNPPEHGRTIPRKTNTQNDDQTAKACSWLSAAPSREELETRMDKIRDSRPVIASSDLVVNAYRAALSSFIDAAPDIEGDQHERTH